VTIPRRWWRKRSSCWAASRSCLTRFHYRPEANIGHPYAAETSVNTNPAVVAATIKAVRKANPKEIIVTEAAAVGCDTLECLEKSGIGKAASDAGADRIIDIKRDKDLIDVPIRDARRR